MTKAKPAPKPLSPQVALVDRYIKAKAKSKAVFSEVCELEEQILGLLEVSPENEFKLPDGRAIMRKDNFAKGNTFFKPAAAKHFEVEIKPAPIVGEPVG
ncbi:MAG: hypothetical protein ACLP9L_41620 [Thermoguttaceae bacterium]